MQKIVISNIRFPEDEWLMLKSAAAYSGMSVNEYLIYLSRLDSIKSATGKKIDTQETGYKAMSNFLNRKIEYKPSKMSVDDEAIYG